MSPVKGLLLSLGAFVALIIVVLVLWALIGPATALIVMLIAAVLAVLATIWLVRALTQTIDPGGTDGQAGGEPGSRRSPTLGIRYAASATSVSPAGV